MCPTSFDVPSVSAGAGSGKTTFLVGRVQCLLESGVSPLAQRMQIWLVDSLLTCLLCRLILSRWW